MVVLLSDFFDSCGVFCTRNLHLYTLYWRTLCTMAENIHYKQPAQLKGCPTTPSPGSIKSPLRTRVEPAYHSNKTLPLTATASKESTYHNILKKKTIFPKFPSSKVYNSQKNIGTFSKPHSLEHKAKGLFNSICSLVFSFSALHVELIAPRRTLVVTQQ